MQISQKRRFTTFQCTVRTKYTCHIYLLLFILRRIHLVVLSLRRLHIYRNICFKVICLEFAFLDFMRTPGQQRYII